MMTLTLPSNDPAAAPARERSLAVAFGVGAGSVMACWGLCWLLALPPAGTDGWTAIGAGAASFAGGLAMAWHGLSSRRGAAGAAAFRLQAILAGSMLAKLFVLVVGVLALRRLGTKFEDIAAFAIAFAAASLVFQVAAAGYLASRNPTATEAPRAHHGPR